MQSKGISLKKKNAKTGNSLTVQWLGPHIFIAVNPGSISGQGTMILQVMQHGKNK